MITAKIEIIHLNKEEDVKTVNLIRTDSGEIHFSIVMSEEQTADFPVIYNNIEPVVFLYDNNSFYVYQDGQNFLILFNYDDNKFYYTRHQLSSYPEDKCLIEEIETELIARFDYECDHTELIGGSSIIKDGVTWYGYVTQDSPTLYYYFRENYSCKRTNAPCLIITRNDDYYDSTLYTYITADYNLDVPDGDTPLEEIVSYGKGTDQVITTTNNINDLDCIYYPSWGENNGLNLIHLEIPRSMDTIKEYAFYGAPIESVIIPDTIRRIESFSFVDTNIRSIIIPDSVIFLGEQVFAGCRELESIVLGKNIAECLGADFVGCSIRSITIPDTWTTIFDGFFMDARYLEEVTLSSSLKKIGYWSFDETQSLRSIIYKGVTYTNQTNLIAALEANNVEVDSSVFHNSGFPVN